MYITNVLSWLRYEKNVFLPKNAVLFKIINSEKTMTHLLNGISEVFYNIFGVLKGISFGDVLDILILTFLIYKAIQLVRETRVSCSRELFFLYSSIFW